MAGIFAFPQQTAATLWDWDIYQRGTCYLSEDRTVVCILTVDWTTTVLGKIHALQDEKI